MQEFNPTTIDEAIVELNSYLPEEAKKLVKFKLGTDSNYNEFMKINSIAAQIANNWIDPKSGQLSQVIPNFDKLYLLEYGQAILKIYQRYLLSENLYLEETLIKVNWIECPMSILENPKY